MRSRSPPRVRAPWRSRVSSPGRPEDRLDALADGAGEPGRFVPARRAHHDDSEVDSSAGELAPDVALVADEHFAASRRQRSSSSSATSARRAAVGQREGSSRVVGSGRQMNRNPQSARSARRAVAGGLAEGRALGVSRLLRLCPVRDASYLAPGVACRSAASRIARSSCRFRCECLPAQRPVRAPSRGTAGWRSTCPSHRRVAPQPRRDGARRSGAGRVR